MKPLKGGNGGDQFFQGMNRDDSGLAAETFPDLYGSGQRSGMGLGGPGSALGLSPFPNDQGFFAGDFSGRLEKGPPVLQSFDIGADDPGLLIVGEVIQKIVGLEIGGVAETDHFAEAQALIRPFLNEMAG